jgi:hypothetical protein
VTADDEATDEGATGDDVATDEEATGDDVATGDAAAADDRDIADGSAEEGDAGDDVMALVSAMDDGSPDAVGGEPRPDEAGGRGAVTDGEASDAGPAAAKGAPDHGDDRPEEA